MKERTYDAVVLFLFGKKETGSFTNTHLINRAIAEAKCCNVPLIVPSAIPACMYEKKRVRVVTFGGETICEYARNVKEDMAREIWKNVLVVAATPIVERCMRDLRKTYPGSVIFHEVVDLRKCVSYHIWFWGAGARFPKARAVLWPMYEKLLFFIPWSIYRWFALPAKLPQ